MMNQTSQGEPPSSPFLKNVAHQVCEARKRAISSQADSQQKKQKEDIDDVVFRSRD